MQLKVVFYFWWNLKVALYECWICIDGDTLQVIRVQVKAGNDLIALQHIKRLYQPVKVLGKPYAVRSINQQDISCPN